MNKNDLKALLYDWEHEYRFHIVRRWRFDHANPEYKIAVEYEGGVWTRGRHVRPKGFQNDCEKYNCAALNGWIVLRYTCNDSEDRVLNDIVGFDSRALRRK